MLELDFEAIQIQTQYGRSLTVHPIGHVGIWADCRAGVTLAWAEGAVVLMSTRFFPDAGCYVSATLMKFPDRPFPADKTEAIGVVKNVLSQFAAALVAAYPAPTPCPTCGGSGADQDQGVGACEACQGYGEIQP